MYNNLNRWQSCTRWILKISFSLEARVILGTILSCLCTFLKWRPRLPDWVKVLPHRWQLNGLIFVCLRKWSLKLQLLLNCCPHPSYLHLKYSLTRWVSGFLTLTVSCHSDGIPSNSLAWKWAESSSIGSLASKRCFSAPYFCSGLDCDPEIVN